jgi:hypothetical protein
MNEIPRVSFNPLTQTYDTLDGTRVAAELVDNVHTPSDVFYIANIREAQRTDQAKLRGSTHE